MLPTKISPKIPYKFICESCDYNCSKLSEYNKHLLTAKHSILQNPIPIKTTFDCSCGKKYKHSSTLYAHRKKCIKEKKQDTIILENNTLEQQLIQHLLKENSEFKQLMVEQNKQMIELAKNAGHNTTNNNQQFNLNFFLNETCKNAMNIMDFVNQLQIKNNDLEETGRLGFANGISRIFINGLKQINIPDRPIHCSDFKRETLYIKNNNEWNKETDEKIILTNAIKQVTHKNMKQITEWTKTHPEYKVSSSKVNDKYLKIVSESMSGSTEDETNKNYSKIVKNILKETVIDK
jgi:hypothetical protein